MVTPYMVTGLIADGGRSTPWQLGLKLCFGLGCRWLRLLVCKTMYYFGFDSHQGFSLLQIGSL